MLYYYSRRSSLPSTADAVTYFIIIHIIILTSHKSDRIIDIWIKYIIIRVSRDCRVRSIGRSAVVAEKTFPIRSRTTCPSQQRQTLSPVDLWWWQQCAHVTAIRFWYCSFRYYYNHISRVIDRDGRRNGSPLMGYTRTIVRIGPSHAP